VLTTKHGHWTYTIEKKLRVTSENIPFQNILREQDVTEEQWKYLKRISPQNTTATKS